MKRAKAIWMATCLSLFLAFIGFTQSPDPSTIIDQVSLHQGELSTQVVLHSKSPPPLFPTYYSAEQPSTIVVDLGEATVNINQPFQFYGNKIVEDVIVEFDKSGRSRLFFPLKQKVPYHVYTYQDTTIIELHEFQNERNADFVPIEVEEKLQNITGKPGYLKGVDMKRSEDRLDFKAKLNGTTIVDIFALEKPFRLVADFYNTIHDLKIPTMEINKEGIKKLRISQFRVSNPGPITRLVFDLEEPRQYSVTSEKNGIFISFKIASEEQAVEEESLTSEITESVDTSHLEQNGNENENSGIEEDPKETKFVIDSILKDTKSNNQTDQPISPEVREENNGSSSKELFFTPQTIGYTGEKYAGEMVNIKFKDADLRDVVLYLGSEVAELNVVFDPGVRGSVTCNLVAVPWDQALDILLKNNKMGRTIEGNILRVAPIATLTQEKQDEKQIQESMEFSEPILIRSYPLSYAKADEVKLLIENKLSERGEIIVDIRMNTLIISDIADRIDIVEQLMEAFDKATPQVTIEARIVEATSTFVRNLGIQWGWRGISDPFYGNQTSLQFPNTVLVDGGIIPQGTVTKGIGGQLGGYAINLPAPAFNSAMGLSLSNVLDTFGLDMALTALETSGNGKVISRPTVTTQNNIQAEIIQGQQIPVQTSANFTVSTTFINAALELRAKPQITEDNTIIMYLEIRNNSPDFGNLVNGIPPITMQSASTTVMIPDGGTTVIGGIYQTDNSISRNRVPFLHKIPLLGSLFRSTSRTETSRELLIFITPKISRR
ncbi:type IV pilus secretin PilQ [Acidobacteriota bacterium]